MRTTSSSISSSEPGPSAAGPGGWGGFTVWLLAATAGLALGLWAALLAVDPYDTGRLGLVARAGLPEQGIRTAGASRGRDPAFDGLVLGNSHIQLVDPAALTRASGIAFMSLAVPATGPMEQLAVLEWWLAHRGRAPRAIVVGTDDAWCGSGPLAAASDPFPFWLYATRAWTYAVGLFRYSSFDAALRRLSFLAGSGRPARADGYSNFEADRRWFTGAIRADLRQPLPSARIGTTGRFPALEALADRVRALPAETALVLVRPPVYVTALPQAGTPLAAAEAACRDAVERIAASRRRSATVDWRSDRPPNRDPSLFFDHSHYRGPMARALEQEIGAALGRVFGPNAVRSP